MSTTDLLSIEDVVTRIITLNTGLRDFWTRSHGWAPIDATDLLSKSRLDWQVSLSYSLRRWIPKPINDEQDATQILAYANLGSLVEGTLKLFLSVYYDTYRVDVDAIMKKGTVQDPDEITLEPLRQYFRKRIWKNIPSDDWDPWISKIQVRRNAIHAFKDRDIGTHGDVMDDIHTYLWFLRRINEQLPYPDPIYQPREDW